MDLIARKPFRAGRRALRPGDKFEAHPTFGEAYIRTGHAVEDMGGVDPATYETRVMEPDVARTRRRRARPRTAEE